MDLSITQWINANWHGVAFLNHFFRLITLLGEHGEIWIASGVIMLFFKKTRRVGIAVLIALALNFLVSNLIIKNAVDRTRPFEADKNIMSFLEEWKVKIPSDSSFPSGHSSSAFAAAVAATLYLKKKGIPFMFLAVIISFSRIFLCVHFVSDVLVGILIGSIIAVAVYFAIERIMKSKAKKLT